MLPRILPALFVVGLFIVAASPPVLFGAVDNQYIEDFTTDTYRDPATTAWWDTITGELKLYPFSMDLMGSDLTPVPARDIVVFGDLAFVVADEAGLHVIDIGDPGSPNQVGSLDMIGRSYGVAVAGDMLYVTSLFMGHFWSVDISDPLNPVLVGGCQTPGDSYGLAVAGDHAFVADYNEGLQVVDISDPIHPSVVGGTETGGRTYSVALAGNHAYVASGNAGLAVVDISDPVNPALVANLVTPGEAFGVAVAGDHVYIADHQTGLQVIDVRDPVNPTSAGWVDTPGNARDVVVDGDLAYVADGGSGLHMIDISQPTNPVLLLSLDTEDAYRVAVAGEHAFVADAAGGVKAVEICLAVNPAPIGTYDSSGRVLDVAVAGDLALLADRESGLKVIDITTPATPILVGNYDTPGQAYGIATAGNLAFIADHEAGLQVIDITDPSTPSLEGSLDTPGTALAVTVAGDLALVADAYSGLQVINISDPAHPFQTGSYDTPGRAQGVAVSGDLALVADDESGLQVIDITDPNNPVLLGQYDTPGESWGVAVAGDLAFLADGWEGMAIVDIADPTSPALIGSCPTYCALGVAVAGDRVFVADAMGWFTVVDISDPANPVVSARALEKDSLHEAYNVAVSGDLVLVADYWLGLQLMQVFQNEVNTDGNVGLSLPVNDQCCIVRARLTSAQTSGVSWELSADMGTNWEVSTPGADWTAFSVSGDDLIWRSTHTWVGSGNPLVSDLTLEWLNQSAPITAVMDVPEDQGGRVYLELARSGYDFEDEATYPVTQYGIYRRVDDPSLVRGIPATGSGILLAGTPYVAGSGELAKTGTFPPGTWALVASVPATQSDEYLVEVTTVADSTATGTAWSTFLVTTHTTTPSVWFACPPDSGYSVDNLAPAAPAEFAVAYDSEGNLLTWSPADAPDFDHFRIYRGLAPDFVPAAGNLVHTTVETSWLDAAKSLFDYHYKLTSVDLAGNESDATGPATVTGAQDDEVPARTALLDAVPNPFNATTTLSFEMAAPGHARLKIYDTAGRLVTVLVDEHRKAGTHHVIWDGRDDRGRSSSAGVYLYRLEAGSHVETKSMALIK